MSAATTQIREWSNEDRTQANVIRWLVAVGEGGAGGDLSNAQADTLEATAEGWDTIADAAEAKEAAGDDGSGAGPEDEA